MGPLSDETLVCICGSFRLACTQPHQWAHSPALSMKHCRALFSGKWSFGKGHFPPVSLFTNGPYIPQTAPKQESKNSQNVGSLTKEYGFPQGLLLRRQLHLDRFAPVCLLTTRSPWFTDFLRISQGLERCVHRLASQDKSQVTEPELASNWKTVLRTLIKTLPVGSDRTRHF